MMSLLHHLLAATALAQQPPMVNCTGLPGCPGPIVQPSNVILTTALPVAVTVLLNLAAAAAIIFIIVAGAQMMIALGDESKLSNAKWAVFYALLGLGLALVSQIIVAFVTTANYGQGVSDNFLFAGALPAVVETVLGLLNVAFLLIIFIAGFRMVIGHGKQEEFGKALTIIRWTIIGAVIINLARAAVEAFLTLTF
jgi:hypothetical protein